MIDSRELLDVGVGAVLALVFAVGVRAFLPQRERWVYGLGLVGAAGVYVAFALLGGAPGPWLALELAGVGLYALPAALGIFASRWFLALGWGAHALWDAVPHTLMYTGWVPNAYPMLCLGFDLAVALYLAATAAAASARWLSHRSA